MRHFFLLLGCLLPGFNFAQSFTTPFERDSAQTATYEQVNEFYRALAQKHRKLSKVSGSGAIYFSIGLSDDGSDIFVFSPNHPNNEKSPKRPAILINNAIHPGEPEGVDASMMLMRDLLQHQDRWHDVLSSFTIYVIAQYNVDGVRNRGCCSRANQNGPVEYGFRGNARNLDLNRDFIKADSRNARMFTRFFCSVKPVIFVDNHTSNGADYQHALTYFASHAAKLSPAPAGWLARLQPSLDTALNRAGWDVCPYVTTRAEVPDSGIIGFFETGRYATGYAALHHCLGFTVETHMLKPFPQRVHANYAFMEELLRLLPVTYQPAPEALHKDVAGTYFPLSWELDARAYDSVWFSGYHAVHEPSAISGQQRLRYLRDQPFRKKIPYYNRYHAVDSAPAPLAFVMPQAWHEVVERLMLNGINLYRLRSDRTELLEVSYIGEVTSARQPYEGHFLHQSIRTRDTLLEVRLNKGDYMIPLNAQNALFLMNTLMPKAPDSYFSWNFFDAILQQKEGYSAYVFEDVAADLLREDTALAAAFTLRKSHDPIFANDGPVQLNWIYRNSAYYEKTHRLYPVYRIRDEAQRNMLLLGAVEQVILPFKPGQYEAANTGNSTRKVRVR